MWDRALVLILTLLALLMSSLSEGQLLPDAWGARSRGRAWGGRGHISRTPSHSTQCCEWDRPRHGSQSLLRVQIIGQLPADASGLKPGPGVQVRTRSGGDSWGQALGMLGTAILVEAPIQADQVVTAHECPQGPNGVPWRAVQLVSSEQRHRERWLA